MSTIQERQQRFRELHESGFFVLPNLWDVGSARVLAELGFPALATTSSGLAAALGKQDTEVTREELLLHVESLSAAVELPLNADSERCYGDDPAGVAETVLLLAQAGAAGCSIEDYNPATNAIDPFEVAVERVGAAAEAAREVGIVLTARCENLLHDVTDFDDTITRMRAYRDAGASVLYAPGLTTPAQIETVVSLGLPVNVLRVPGAPPAADLAALGVRRMSAGGALAKQAYAALRTAASELAQGRS